MQVNSFVVQSTPLSRTIFFDLLKQKNMNPVQTKPLAASLNTDPRLKLIAAKIKKENARPDALIEILHIAQNAYGYLPMNVLKYITQALHLPPSRVYATVSFYHFFSLASKGAHTCLVCTGTACYVKGAPQILKEIENEFGLLPGQVSANNQLGLAVARCIGACGLAPVVVLDDEVQARTSASEILTTIHSKLP
jgi:bidirectional [NiFe] hydrogenase diaphorase subunit